LEAGDKNTSYFHKQAEARKQFKKVMEIQVQNQTITDFEGIKAVAADAFETLYTETQDLQLTPKLTLSLLSRISSKKKSTIV
jgi:hypothetical protein